MKLEEEKRALQLLVSDIDIHIQRKSSPHIFAKPPICGEDGEESSSDIVVVDCKSGSFGDGRGYK
jgi:hypothetical protein